VGKIDFNKVIERKNTYSLKYDFIKERGKNEDVIPLWVADMDFQTPPEVINALVDLSRHGIFGYSEVKEDYYNVVSNWFLTRHNFKINNDWVVKTPGIVFGLAAMVRAFTNIKENILLCSPVYYPFFEVINDNNRVVVDVPLINLNNEFFLDFINIEKEIKNKNIKLMIFCSPHNPVGRVWSREELIRLGLICKKYNCIIISDEIHMDLVYKNNKHEVFQNLQDDFKEFIITCTSASKTFNLAGLLLSNIIIANKQLRKLLNDEINRQGYSQHNIFGLVATYNAYKYCGYYVDELMDYINDNFNYLNQYIQTYLNKIKVIKPEGTYLVWLDFREYNLDKETLEDLIVNKAKLWLDRGTLFGETGIGYQRINIACPLETIKKALNNLKVVFEKL
jgi:cystathionine beta-lyase